MSEVRTMSIHRALTELKTLDSRITDAINSSVFCVANKHSNAKIQGETIEDYKKVMVGSFDKVQSLIDLRNKIKQAIVESNAITMVPVGGVDMTVATAIERKTSIVYEKQFLYALNAQFKKANATINTENEKLPAKLETYLQSVLGDKAQRSAEEIEAHTKSFNEKNTYDLIDPNQLRKRIEEMNDRIVAFETDVDAALSESNAITMIEIEI